MTGARLFRGRFTAIEESPDKGLRTAQLIVRGVRTLPNVPMSQQRGLVSMPAAGDMALVMEVDDLDLVIGSDSKDRPSVAAGETALYANAQTWLKLSPDKTITVRSGSGSEIVISPDGSVSVKGTKVTVEASQIANVLSPKIGLGKDAAFGTPLEMPVTTACSCVFGVPHPMGVPGVVIPLVPSP